MKPRRIPVEIIRSDKEAVERFWAKVEVGDPGQCWLWTGSVSTAKGHSYGVWNFWDIPYKVHRIAYSLKVGPIPEGLTIDHLCKTKLCCNPAHMEPVPQSVNSVRGNLKDRCACGNPRGEKQRRCVECHNRWFREYRLKNIQKCKAIAKASYERIGRETKRNRASRP